MLLEYSHGSLPSEGPRSSEEDSVALAVQRHSQGTVERTIGTTAASRAVLVGVEFLCVVEIVVVSLPTGAELVLPAQALHGEELLGDGGPAAPEGLGDPHLPPGGAAVQAPLLGDSWVGGSERRGFTS